MHSWDNSILGSKRTLLRISLRQIASEELVPPRTSGTIYLDFRRMRMGSWMRHVP